MADPLSRGVLGFLLALTAIRLVVAGAAPLSPDETYYWVWSRALALSYFDHPPMVALAVRAGTAVFGATALGVRLLAPLLALAGSFLLAAAGRDLLGLDRRGADRAVLLLNATLMLAAGAVTMTPDTPLIFFWTATLAALGRALAGQVRVFLPVAGLCCGLAFCSKYTGVLLVPAIAGMILVHGQTRAWLGRPAAGAGAALALLATLPVLLWNGAHDDASFAKQGGRVGDFHPTHALGFEAELLGGQLGLLTPLVFVLAVAGLVLCARRARAGRPGATLVLLAVLVPAAVFVLHAIGGRVQANWPAVMAPAAALAASLPRFRRLPAIAAAALGYALAVPLYVQATAGVFPLAPHFDVTLARLGGWPALAAGVAQADTEGLPVAADDYALASELAWNCAAPAVLGAEPRWRFFRLPHLVPAGEVLLLRSRRRTDAPLAAVWPGHRGVAVLARARGGLVAERYALSRTGVAMPPLEIALLPRPARCDAPR